MKKMEECRFGIVGLGLMGGSFAMALKRENITGVKGRILAYDIDDAVLAEAQKRGIIHEGFSNPLPMLRESDVILICLNPGASIHFMEKYIDDFLPGAIIMDIAGVKRGIAGCIKAILRHDIDFIPGHPMAGSEKGGFFEAGKCNFTGRNFILTPLEQNHPENVDFLKDLIRRIGFGRITETSPAEHDRKIAFTSQLCHVIAAALINCEDDPAISLFGGGSFEEFTRIAMMNAPMWTELFLENRDELLECIKRFESSLDAIREMIQKSDSELLQQTLSEVRRRRIIMAEK